MAALALELQRVEKERRLAEFTKNENLVAGRLSVPPAEPLSDAERELLGPFINWAQQRGVRALPARPEVVAAYVQEIAPAMGEAAVLSVVDAIRRLNIAQLAFADPTSSRAVQFVLDQIVKKVEPPRSWTKLEKEEFQKLPPHIQAIVVRREREREAGFRRAQNQLAEERKKLTQTQQKENESVESKTEGTNGRGESEQSARTSAASPG